MTSACWSTAHCMPANTVESSPDLALDSTLPMTRPARSAGRRAAAGDGRGDVRPVTVAVGRGRVLGEVLRIDHTTREVGVSRVVARVENRDLDTTAVESATPRLGRVDLRHRVLQVDRHAAVEVYAHRTVGETARHARGAATSRPSRTPGRGLWSPRMRRHRPWAQSVCGGQRWDRPHSTPEQRRLHCHSARATSRHGSRRPPHQGAAPWRRADKARPVGQARLPESESRQERQHHQVESSGQPQLRRRWPAASDLPSCQDDHRARACRAQSRPRASSMSLHTRSPNHEETL